MIISESDVAFWAGGDGDCSVYLVTIYLRECSRQYSRVATDSMSGYRTSGDMDMERMDSKSKTQRMGESLVGPASACGKYRQVPTYPKDLTRTMYVTVTQIGFFLIEVGKTVVISVLV